MSSLILTSLEAGVIGLREAVGMRIRAAVVLQLANILTCSIVAASGDLVRVASMLHLLTPLRLTNIDLTVEVLRMAVLLGAT